MELFPFLILKNQIFTMLIFLVGKIFPISPKSRAFWLILLHIKAKLTLEWNGKECHRGVTARPSRHVYFKFNDTTGMRVRVEGDEYPPSEGWRAGKLRNNDTILNAKRGIKLPLDEWKQSAPGNIYWVFYETEGISRFTFENAHCRSTFYNSQNINRNLKVRICT